MVRSILLGAAVAVLVPVLASLLLDDMGLAGLLDSSGLSADRLSPAVAAVPWQQVVSKLTFCNIPIVEADQLSLEAYRRRYKGKRPFALRRPVDHTREFREATTHAALLDRFDDLEVTLASSNSFSHDKQASTLGWYMRHHMHPLTPDSLANETWYMFGDTFEPVWMEVAAMYPVPLDAGADEGLRVFGLGGSGSGVAYHTHGAAWAETVHGRKRWFLSPPGVRPQFEGDVSQLRWAVDNWRAYASRNASGAGTNTDTSGAPFECTLGVGDVLYIPPNWWHATLNLDDYNVFISTFTREKESEYLPDEAAEEEQQEATELAESVSSDAPSTAEDDAREL